MRDPFSKVYNGEAADIVGLSFRISAQRVMTRQRKEVPFGSEYIETSTLVHGSAETKEGTPESTPHDQRRPRADVCICVCVCARWRARVCVSVCADVSSAAVGRVVWPCPSAVRHVDEAAFTDSPA